MRVSGKTGASGVGSSTKAGGPPPAASPVAASPGSGPLTVSDAFSVSSTAHFVAVAQIELAKIPEIRVDKVEQLRAQLEAENYHPDEDAVAWGLLKEHSPVPRES